MEKNTTECENTISFMESVVNRNDKDINTMKNIKKIDRKIYLISQNRIKYQWKMISKKEWMYLILSILLSSIPMIIIYIFQCYASIVIPSIVSRISNAFLSLIKPTAQSLKTPNGITIDRFIYQTGNDFYNYDYIGRSDLLLNTVKSIVRDTVLINNFKTDLDQLKKIHSVNNQYMFFIGNPGTGKTQFVKKLVFEVDKILKYLYNSQLTQPITWDQFKNFSFTTITSDIAKQLRGLESRVRFYNINIGDITSKSYGMSGILVKQLFDEISNFENYLIPDYRAHIVLLDESETFFGERTFNTLHTYANDRITAFFEGFSALRKTPKPVFIIAITNIYERIDSAIKLQIPNTITFGYPTQLDYKAMMTTILKDKLSSSLTDNEITEIINITQSKVPHSIFISKLKENIEYNMDGDAVCFNKERFKQHLEEYLALMQRSTRANKAFNIKK